jgi:hypothetical protein
VVEEGQIIENLSKQLIPSSVVQLLGEATRCLEEACPLVASFAVRSNFEYQADNYSSVHCDTFSSRVDKGLKMVKAHAALIMDMVFKQATKALCLERAS